MNRSAPRRDLTLAFVRRRDLREAMGCREDRQEGLPSVQTGSDSSCDQVEVMEAAERNGQI